MSQQKGRDLICVPSTLVSQLARTHGIGSAALSQWTQPRATKCESVSNRRGVRVAPCNTNRCSVTLATFVQYKGYASNTWRANSSKFTATHYAKGTAKICMHVDLERELPIPFCKRFGPYMMRSIADQRIAAISRLAKEHISVQLGLAK